MRQFIDHAFLVPDGGGYVINVKIKQSFLLQVLQLPQEEQFVDTSSDVLVLVWGVHGLLGLLWASAASFEVHVVVVVFGHGLVDASAIDWVPVGVAAVQLCLDFADLLVDLLKGLLEWGFVQFLLIHFTCRNFFIVSFFIGEKVTEVVVSRRCGSGNSLFN